MPEHLIAKSVLAKETGEGCEDITAKIYSKLLFAFGNSDYP